MKTTRKSAAAIAAADKSPVDGRSRAVIDALLPCVDGGRFAAKRVAGEPVAVTAHAITDGHDALRVMLRWRAETESERAVREVEMVLSNNDRWHAEFVPPLPGRYVYSATAWVDHFRSWRQELKRRVDAADIHVAALVGAELIEQAAGRAKGADKKTLKDWAKSLRKAAAAADDDDGSALKSQALDATLAEVADRCPDRSLAVQSIELPLVADRLRARFSSWYELFPRSASPEPARHGTFADVEARLPYIAAMGFDVLYLPPIHPIGREQRKGRNNVLVAEMGDVGSPWAIGAVEGGHKDILPELGTLEDFRRLVAAANAMGLEVALDIAFQCAPDHPHVQAHPQWFRWRPDGSVQYAENPPKKYQDIYPFNFESDDWQALWAELKSVFDHWIAQGVKIFRVDNPHTKSFAFWEWVIGELKREHPELIFLAEAFTRPKVMHRLAKLGYTQSYTYYTWRNTGPELIEYFTELNEAPGRDYFRPNVWPNTPDILHEQLQGGQRAMFMSRLVLATTLAANYGIYGPAYELLEHLPRHAGSEEYLDSEKYQRRVWDLNRSESLAPLITRLNRIRHDNPALQADHSLRFCSSNNETLVAYTKQSADGDNVIITIVNLDPQFTQSGWIGLDLQALGIPANAPYRVDDLLADTHYLWHGSHNFVMLDPAKLPAHVLRLHREADNTAPFQ